MGAIVMPSYRGDQGRSPKIIHVYMHAHARAQERHSLADLYRLGNDCSAHTLRARAPWPWSLWRRHVSFTSSQWDREEEGACSSPWWRTPLAVEGGRVRCRLAILHRSRGGVGAPLHTQSRTRAPPHGKVMVGGLSALLMLPIENPKADLDLRMIIEAPLLLAIPAESPPPL
jgi:hypothetical protein